MQHRERVPASSGFRWLIRAAVIVPLIVGLLVVMADDDPHIVGVVSLLVVLGLMLLLERWAMNLDVTVGGGMVQVAFGPIRRRLPLTSIVSVEVEPYRWTQYGGWGIRWGRQKHHAWSVPFLQTGVVLELDDSRRYYLSSRAPEILQSQIQQLIDSPRVPSVGEVSGGVRG